MKTRRAIFIGIDEYRSQPLVGCVNDAEEMAAMFEMEEFGFDVKVFTNDDATKSAIKNEVMWAVQASEVAVIYFAGHGGSSDLGTHFISYDYELLDPGISFEYLRSLMNSQSVACNAIVLILDCCHSGAAKPRDMFEVVALPKTLTAADVNRSVRLTAPGRVVLAACEEDQLAYPTPDGAHGAFTACLLSGLTGDACDENGILTVHGLYDYIASKMSRGVKQVPMFRGDVSGRLILAENLTPGIVRRVSSQEITKRVQDAELNLEQYHAIKGAPLPEWRDTGYKAACDALQPIVEWFEKRRVDTPGLAEHRRFKELEDEVTTQQQQLGQVDVGFTTKYGAVEERLGAGTFGTVFRCKQSDGRSRVLKVYHPQDLLVKDKRKRFRQGYSAMRQLDHPNIVKVHEYSECPVGFTMSYIDGPNLREFYGIENPAEQVSILVGVADTLQHAHSRNVVHRDVKPENIILEQNDNGVWVPHLTDFDLAWFSTATLVTMEAIGTIFYAAPEQLSKPGSAIAHAKTTDVYSLGQLMYYMFTGSDPVPLNQADNSRALRTRLNNWGSGEAARLALELYDDCTADDPVNRIGTCREVADELTRILTELRRVSRNDGMNPGEFLSEVGFSMSGLGAAASTDDEVVSSSGRTQMVVAVNSQAKGRVDVECRFIPLGRFGKEGLSGDAARTKTNTAIDNALRSYANIRRRSGKQGVFEVYIDIANLPLDSNGVISCVKILKRVIDVIER